MPPRKRAKKSGPGRRASTKTGAKKRSGKTILDLPPETLRLIAKDIDEDDGRNFTAVHSYLKEAGESRAWQHLLIEGPVGEEHRRGGSQSVRDRVETLIHLFERDPRRVQYVKALHINWPADDLETDEYHNDEHPVWPGAGTRTQARWKILLRALPCFRSCATFNLYTGNPAIFDYIPLLLRALPNLRLFALHHRDDPAWNDHRPLALPTFPPDIKSPEILYFCLGHPDQAKQLKSLVQWAGPDLRTLFVNASPRWDKREETRQAIKQTLIECKDALVKLHTLQVQVESYPEEEVGENLKELHLINVSHGYVDFPLEMLKHIPQRNSLETLTLDGVQAVPSIQICRHAFRISERFASRLVGAPQLTTLKCGEQSDDVQELRIREFEGSEHPLWHLRLVYVPDEDDPLPMTLKDYTHYKGRTIPIDILRLVYQKAGLKWQDFEGARDLTLPSEAFGILDLWADSMEGEEDVTSCDRCAS